MLDLTPVLTGFALSAGLIMAIGSQNAFVLRQGLRREHVGPVVLGQPRPLDVGDLLAPGG